MSESETPLHDWLAERNAMRLFMQVSFPDRLRRILTGLQSPRSSGDYKFARAELAHLVSWLAAVVVPVLAFAVIALLAAVPPRARVPIGGIRLLPRPLEPLPEIDPRPPPEETFSETGVLADHAVTPVHPCDAAEAPPLPPAAPSAPMIRSPVTMAGLFAMPGPGAAFKATIPTVTKPSYEGAVMNALRWLKTEQRADGSWVEPPAAMTGLALLTFLAHGETAASPEFGDTVERAMKWLLINQQSDGRFNGRDKHDYSQPIAAYSLAEAYGMTHNPLLLDPAERSIDVIIRGQHASGGWDYNCRQSNRDDTSYMGWCAQALKAAHMSGLKNAGLGDAMRRATAGFKKNSHLSGGFGYTTPGATGLTGVGVLCLQLLGEPRAPEVRSGLTWLERVTCDWSQPWGPRPIYYWYYTTQAKYHAQGADWNAWDAQFAVELVRNQIREQDPEDPGTTLGHWASPGNGERHGLVYSTTLCTLMLEVYYRYLRTYELPAPGTDLANALSEDGDWVIMEDLP